MSTVMYCYKVRRDRWWELAAKLQKFYCEGHELVEIIRDSADESVEGKKLKREKWLKQFSKPTFIQNHTSELQLFELDDDHYLFRVLEASYRFMNNFEEQEWPIEAVFYDNRTDVPLEDKDNKQIAEWMDNQVRQRQFFLWPLVDKVLIFKWLWEWDRQYLTFS